jgi:hypothetical protein
MQFARRFTRSMREKLRRSTPQVANVTDTEEPTGEAVAQTIPLSKSNRFDFAAGLTRASIVSDFIQGEVLEGLADSCVIVSDLEWPLCEASATMAEAEPGGGTAVVSLSSDLVVLLTQTCDLQRTTPEAYFCQIARVVHKDEDFAKQAAHGHRPGWVDLPWHTPTSVVNLAETTTVERSLLVGATSVAQPTGTKARLHFGEMVSRHFTRFAFPDHVSDTMDPLMNHIDEKFEKGSPEGRCVAAVGTIRLEANPDFDSPCPDFLVIFVFKSEDLPGLTPDQRRNLDTRAIDDFCSFGKGALATSLLNEIDPIKKREMWTALAELWVEPCHDVAERFDDVGDIDVLVLNDEEFSFGRSLNAPELDLAYLTSRTRRPKKPKS